MVSHPSPPLVEATELNAVPALLPKHHLYAQSRDCPPKQSHPHRLTQSVPSGREMHTSWISALVIPLLAVAVKPSQQRLWCQKSVLPRVVGLTVIPLFHDAVGVAQLQVQDDEQEAEQVLEDVPEVNEVQADAWEVRGVQEDVLEVQQEVQEDVQQEQEVPEEVHEEKQVMVQVVQQAVVQVAQQVVQVVV